MSIIKGDFKQLQIFTFGPPNENMNTVFSAITNRQAPNIEMIERGMVDG